MQRSLLRGDIVDVLLASLSRMQNPMIKHYPFMYAYGHHFRVDDEIGQSHISFDSGVACLATQVCKSSRVDTNPVEATLKYIGILKDKLQVEYGHLKYVVLKCSWIRPDLEGASTIREDSHGFWSVKYDARQATSMEPFLMPTHAKQVTTAPSYCDNGMISSPIYVVFYN